MKCEYCNNDLYAAKAEKVKNDTYIKQSFVCTNPNCEMYSGTDLSNPKHVAATRLTKIDNLS